MAVELPDFRALVEGLLRHVPAAYLDGVVAVDVSPKTVPHPVRGDVYTLGECIPLEWSGHGADLQSRVILYHGSFVALAHMGGGAGSDDFDWREEAWETLSHELRHHLEWRANEAALEAFDWAAEQNFARHDGNAFDPAFYRSGEKVTEGVYKVDDDVFLEGAGVSVHGERVVTWHGRRYRVPLPAGLRPPAFVTLQGLADQPPGDAILVLSRRASLFDLWRRPRVTQATVVVAPRDG